MTIGQMLTEIRRVIAKCDDSEKDVYEALDSEAEGWRERLRELDDEEEQDDE